MISTTPRFGMLTAVGAALTIFQLSVASAQTRPSQDTTTFTPARVRAATMVLDTHVKKHPKSKDAAVAGRKASANATDVERTRAIRTPVPAVRAKAKAKKSP